MEKLGVWGQSVVMSFVMCFVVLTAAEARPTSLCDFRHSADFRLETQFDKVALDTSKTIDQITQIASQTNSVSLGRFNTLLGLATSQVSFGYSATIQYNTQGDRICALPGRVNFKLAFEDNKIYVSKESTKSRCTYNQVLNHEKKHVRVDQRIMREYKVKLSRYLASIERRFEPQIYSSVDEANRAIQGKIAQLTSSINNDVAEKLRREQAKVDTPAEYERISKECNGAFYDIVQQRRQRR